MIYVYNVFINYIKIIYALYVRKIIGYLEKVEIYIVKNLKIVRIVIILGIFQIVNYLDN